VTKANPLITRFPSDYRVLLRVFEAVFDGLHHLLSCCMLLASNAFGLFGSPPCNAVYGTEVDCRNIPRHSCLIDAPEVVSIGFPTLAFDAIT
jgi:hypothetical protein